MRIHVETNASVKIEPIASDCADDWCFAQPMKFRKLGYAASVCNFTAKSMNSNRDITQGLKL